MTESSKKQELSDTARTGLSKDEIGRALNIALQIHLGVLLREQRVLVSIQPARIASNLVPVVAQCDGLGAYSKAVFNVDVVYGDVVGVYAKRACLVV